MSKTKQHEQPETIQPAVIQASPPSRVGFLPKPILIIAAILLLAGILVGATRKSRTASGLLEAMEGCGASLRVEPGQDREKKESESNGLNDMYGIVRFSNNQTQIAEMLTLCDMEPPLALEVFRSALDRRNKNGQMVALYSSYFLAGVGQLEQEDWERMLQALNPEKEKNSDVRRVAQRALSDLTFITNAAAAKTYDVIPEGAKEPTDGTSNRIQTHEEKLKSAPQKGLNVRWSNPDLAYVWLQKNSDKGHWDKTLQRYIYGK